MTLMKHDILRHISDSLNQDDILERLNLTNDYLVEKLSSEIMQNLDAFDDIYTEDEMEEDDWV